MAARTEAGRPLVTVDRVAGDRETQPALNMERRASHAASHVDSPEDMDDRTSREPGPPEAQAAATGSSSLKAPDTTVVDGESVTYQLQHLATIAFLGWLGLLAVLIPLLWLWSWELVRALTLGLLVGVGASVLHRFNLKRKAAMAQRVGWGTVGQGHRESVRQLHGAACVRGFRWWRWRALSHSLLWQGLLVRHLRSCPGTQSCPIGTSCSFG